MTALHHHGMRVAHIVWIGLAAALAGCGNPLAGSYKAEFRPIEGYKETGRQTPHSKLREDLAANPRVIVLDANGGFTFKTGAETTWLGTWRATDKAVFLKAKTVKGIIVGSALQYEKEYKLENGNFIDSTSTADGYEYVYKK